MSREQEFAAKTVEAAIAEAEQALGKSRDDLEIQVLSQGSRGVFGLGGEPARVLARDPLASSVGEIPPAPAVVETDLGEEQNEVEVAVEAVTVSETPQELEEAPAVEPQRTRRRPRAERSDFAERDDSVTVDPAELGPAAQEVLTNLLEKMGLEVEVSVREGEDPMTLDVKGENLGILIGRRGDSLGSLQFMLNVILSKQFKTWPRVVVDVEGYRARREQSLSSLGQRVAERVRRNRRPFTLEAMPASDRRIIHLALRDRNDIETYSIGEGQSRRIVIAPKR